MGDAERKVVPWPRVSAAGGFSGGPEGPGFSGGGWMRWPGMRTIAYMSASKGSGKTTLAAQTAVQAEISGAGPVAVIDTDPEGQLAEWWNKRRAEYPALAHTITSRIAEDLPRLRDLGIKTCIVDTPGALDCSLEKVVAAVDIVAIPCRPNPPDLRGAGAVVELVERLGKRLVFVINAATSRARITAEAAIALSQYGTLAPLNVHDRVELRDCMTDGQAVFEINPGCDAAKEIMELWQYLDDRLSRICS